MFWIDVVFEQHHQLYLKKSRREVAMRFTIFKRYNMSAAVCLRQSLAYRRTSICFASFFIYPLIMYLLVFLEPAIFSYSLSSGKSHYLHSFQLPFYPFRCHFACFTAIFACFTAISHLFLLSDGDSSFLVGSPAKRCQFLFLRSRPPVWRLPLFVCSVTPSIFQRWSKASLCLKSFLLLQ